MKDRKRHEHAEDMSNEELATLREISQEMSITKPENEATKPDRREKYEGKRQQHRGDDAGSKT